MLQDSQKKLGQLRESVKKEVQVKLREQERKLKDWLTAIPVHGIQVIDMPLQ